MTFSGFQRAFLQIALLTTSVTTCFGDGRVRFFRRVDQSFDPYLQAPSTTQQQWLRDHFYRMEVFSPFFDSRTSWYPSSLVYQDIYAIYSSSTLVEQHPEWILKDVSGSRLFIPWGCSGGTCPQYAADISNSAFRRWWIDEAKRRLSYGYRGIWIDDVNMEFRVGDGAGNFVTPYDRNTGSLMTWDNWRRYMAEFTEQIRLELPGVELLHNSIWYAGPSAVRDSDPYIRRQISSGDIINIEHGVNDPGLTGGTGIWSLSALHAFIDRVHGLGKPVVIDDFAKTTTEKEYALANYFLVNDHADCVGNMVDTPDNWWSGYDVDIGASTSARLTWNGLLRRDYQGGLVLVNEPDAPVRTVTLPGTFRTLAGSSVTSVTLAAKTGMVLIRTSSDTTAPVITGVNATVTFSSATITWTTDEASSTRVEYGVTSSLGTTIATNNTPVKAHSASIAGLNSGTTYYYRVLSSDAAGNLASSPVLKFTTTSVRDVAAPVISSVSPTGSAVSLSCVISAVASEPVSTSTVTPSTVYLLAPGGATVSANISYDATARKITLAPSAPLTASTNYKVVLKGGSMGIKDIAGNAMAANYTWSFTTGSSLTRYLSDLPVSVVKNGYGPVEKDKSNGGSSAGDGVAMKLNGVAFSKGLGVHAGSEVRYSMNGACSTFRASVGVDDEVGTYGSIAFEVWADGVQLYASGPMTGTTATKAVNINLAGRKELTLIVNDTGDGNSYDHGDWADARLDCATTTVQTTYLSDWTWMSATNGWGPVETDRSVNGNLAGDGGTLTLNGVTYAKGLGVHAVSTIEYALGGTCTTFTADVGVDDEIAADWATIVFEIWADGVKLYGSPVMRYNSPTQTVNVSLSGKQKLTLKVTNGGDNSNSDHGDWANAKLSCAR